VSSDKIKQELHFRSDEAFEHPVPLSSQAVEALRAVRWLTGRSPLVFPGARFGLKPISKNAIGYLYNCEGYKGRHVPHGWRSSFSTIMNEQAERELGTDVRLLADRMIIDLMLAHTPKGMSASELCLAWPRIQLAVRLCRLLLPPALPPRLRSALELWCFHGAVYRFAERFRNWRKSGARPWDLAASHATGAMPYGPSSSIARLAKTPYRFQRLIALECTGARTCTALAVATACRLLCGDRQASSHSSPQNAIKSRVCAS